MKLMLVIASLLTSSVYPLIGKPETLLIECPHFWHISTLFHSIDSVLSTSALTSSTITLTPLSYEHPLTTGSLSLSSA